MGQVSFQGIRQVILLTAHPVTHVSGLICYLSIRFGPAPGLSPDLCPLTSDLSLPSDL